MLLLHLHSCSPLQLWQSSIIAQEDENSNIKVIKKLPTPVHHPHVLMCSKGSQKRAKEPKEKTEMEKDR